MKSQWKGILTNMPDRDITSEIESLTVSVKKWVDKCTVASNTENPETLSVGLVELARVNSSLGRKGKYAMWIARTAEHAYKASREQYKVDAIEKGKTATYGDTQRYIQSTGEHSVWVDALLVAEQAEDLAYRTSDFMKYAQSRLSLIKEDIRRG